MSIKIKKGFDKNTVLRVDVSNSSEEEKKRVQDVFFALGYKWWWGEGYRYYGNSVKSYANAKRFSNTADHYLLFGDVIINQEYLTPEQFFDLVLDKTEEKGMIPFDSNKIKTGKYDLYQNYTYKEGVLVESFKVVEVEGVEGIVILNKTFNDLMVIETKFLYLKPKIKYHTVNGVKIPDLRIKEMMSSGKGYMVSVSSPDFYGTCEIIPNYLVSRGLVYERTDEGKQAAILHAKALLGLVEQNTL